MSHKEAFLSKIKSGALAAWRKHKVLPSLVAAQAALESGWGTSQLAIKGNNLFGIKAHGWRGPTLVLPTKEYLNKKWVTVDATWRKYDSWAESVEDHGLFFVQNHRYKKLLGETDYVKACRAVHAAGYATDPDYADKLLATIRANGLDAWDREVLGQAPAKKEQPSAPAGKYYIVKAGDTLTRIAANHKTTVNALAKMNNIKNVNLIKTGQKLRVK